MKLPPKIKILILIFSLNIFGFSQTVEDGWKGIKPLKTDKFTVNKILGTPKVDDNGYYGYSLNEAFIQVNYSTLPCEDNQYKRGKYNTVLDYIVNINKVMKLSELKFNREKYIVETSNHYKRCHLLHQ